MAALHAVAQRGVGRHQRDTAGAEKEDEQVEHEKAFPNVKAFD